MEISSTQQATATHAPTKVDLLLVLGVDGESVVSFGVIWFNHFCQKYENMAKNLYHTRKKKGRLRGLCPHIRETGTNMHVCVWFRVICVELWVISIARVVYALILIGEQLWQCFKRIYAITTSKQWKYFLVEIKSLKIMIFWQSFIPFLGRMLRIGHEHWSICLIYRLAVLSWKINQGTSPRFKIFVEYIYLNSSGLWKSRPVGWR